MSSDKNFNYGELYVSDIFTERAESRSSKRLSKFLAFVESPKNYFDSSKISSSAIKDDYTWISNNIFFVSAAGHCAWSLTLHLLGQSNVFPFSKYAGLAIPQKMWQ